MFQFHFINTPNFTINTNHVGKIFAVFKKEVSIIQNWQVNIVFVDAEAIKNLNKTYRNKDTSTDVLSFHYFDNYNNLSENDIAGELIFCEEKITSQWKEYGLWEEFEFYKLLIHSLLHILWYDHEKDDEYEIMQNLENIIAYEVFWKKFN